MYKITVIIPCYNVGEYLERCLESIMNQEIGSENLQIITVNDGSTDNTLEILMQYEQRYADNICVINLEENKGMSYARNLAMQYAVADYIMFIDADDWIEQDMLQRMWQIRSKLDTDVVMCVADRPISTEAAGREREADDYYACPQSVEERKDMFLTLEKNTVSWAKLVKKSVLLENHIDFPEGYAFEDSYWAYLLYLTAKDVYVINESLYHWYNNPKSTVNSGRKYLDVITVQEMLLQELKSRNLYEIYKDEIEYSYYRVVFVHTVYSAFRFGHISVQLVNALKNIISKRCDITNNPYFYDESMLKNSGRNEVVRQMILQEVDEQLLIEIYSELKGED